MNLSRNDGCLLSSSISEEEIMIKELLLAHDPDKRRHVDSQLLLRAVETTLNHAIASEVFGYYIGSTIKNNVDNIEEFGSQEHLGQVISTISNKMVCKCSGESDLRTKTMAVFELIGNYKWDAKVVLMLAAFAVTYARFSLIMQHCSQNHLAASVARLKLLPRDLRKLKPRFKAMSSLIKVMVDVIKCIIRFEGLPLRHVKLDDETMIRTKSFIYAATYWVTRSSLVCSSQISDMIGLNPEQMTSAVAAWELSSLALRLSRIFGPLKLQVDLCHQRTDAKMHEKLLEIFQAAHPDNQEVLDILLASKDDLPLKEPRTHARLGVSKLKNKVVVLLITKPELLPLDELFLLVHQTDDHPHNMNLEGDYAIVWIPISLSDAWTDAEEEIFNFLSSTFPWYSVRQPWEMNTTVVDYIKQEWNFTVDPVMVVLQSDGTITNTNAIDMVLSWGPRAHPFSSSKEKELWEEQNLTVLLLVDQIDPLLPFWVEEGRHICLYASDNLQSVTKLNTIFKEIKNSGMQLELVYVGKSSLNEQIKAILSIIHQDFHNNPLSFTKLHFFWQRLQSIRRSLQRMEQSKKSQNLLNQVTRLLEHDENDGWVILGSGVGSDIATLQINEAFDILNRFNEWGQYVTKLGFSGAIRSVLEEGPPAVKECNHSKVVPYSEDLVQGNVVCEKCKRTMKQFIVYE